MVTGQARQIKWPFHYDGVIRAVKELVEQRHIPFPGLKVNQDPHPQNIRMGTLDWRYLFQFFIAHTMRLRPGFSSSWGPGMACVRLAPVRSVSTVMGLP